MFWEWIKDTNTENYGANSNMASVSSTTHTAEHSLSGGTTTTARHAKDQFGPTGDYSGLSTDPYGGLGHAALNANSGGIRRGGGYSTRGHAGIFSVSLFSPVGSYWKGLGFRCVYHPPSD